MPCPALGNRQAYEPSWPISFSSQLWMLSQQSGGWEIWLEPPRCRAISLLRPGALGPPAGQPSLPVRLREEG